MPAAEIVVEDGVARCSWCAGSGLYRDYHDTEWGRPVADDVRLFEKLCLEGFQAGLSWLTILRKRENFRRAFAGFDVAVLAEWGPPEVDALLQDAGIVRHRGKIEAVLTNARCCLDLVASHGSLAAYAWAYESTVDAVAMSKDLKKRGWAFVGPTTVYAFMQSMGLVNDHAPACDLHPVVERDRATFTRPVR